MNFPSRRRKCPCCSLFFTPDPHNWGRQLYCGAPACRRASKAAKPFKQWAAIFNNDSTIASAVLDCLLHHADTILIQAPSYRMKDQAGE